MRNDFSSNYLAHHGILGQKWGHKNGPPYPLDAGDHSSSEKKAGWKESLSKKREQKKLAKSIKKATKGVSQVDVAEKAIGSDIRSRLSKDQKENLVFLKKKMEKDQDASTKEYSKIYNQEYSKRFKNNKKPSEHELDELQEYVANKHIGSKVSEQAFKSWDEYIKYSRDITENLIGKYGNTRLSNNNQTYKTMVSRVLDDLQDEKAYKQAFSQWNNAESKWYWNSDKSKTDSFNKKRKELGEKEAEFETKLKSKGYTDKEIDDMREAALAEDPSYHKYEEEYYKKRRGTK